ncbi:MAG: 4Fe-4S dicluster domain-containing protein [Termitinemataceae bacterium]|nr:MAG: 4Fe-4S dicluster domain-containing protein [Termitinemataceae bacterium]
MSVEQSFFVLADQKKCTGCRACELACFAGHQNKKPLTVGNITSPVTPRLFVTKTAGSNPQPSAGEDADFGTCMPVQCHHCEDAPCLRSCLSGAIERRDGVVFINERKCIGCRNCALSCPFGAVQVYSFIDLPQQADGKNAPKLVYKCDLCKDAKEPACVATCPNEALRVVDPATEIRIKREEALNAMDGFGPSHDALSAASDAQGGK